MKVCEGVVVEAKTIGCAMQKQLKCLRSNEKEARKKRGKIQ